MGSINLRELFPNKQTVVIFVLYIALFINQGILVRWSQRDGQYDYNTVIVVLVSEVIKLVASITLFCRDGNTIVQLCRDVKKYQRVFLLYMIPSVLYCLYNNLAFVNLAVFDPTTYFLLLQLRVVLTGIVFQVIFKKQLSRKQWLSLILLTFGCMMKHINLDFSDKLSVSTVHLNINIIFILIQTFCSCLAGVYNEYLLKGEGAEINIFVQNVFMYTDSIICNLVVITSQGELLSVFNNSENIFMNYKVMLIMFNNAAVGIITSFFLKNLNSIVKTFASALELVFTAIFCWFLFSIPIHLNTAIAIAIVSYSVILYSQNPVQNAVPKIHSENYDKEKLISV